MKMKIIPNVLGQPIRQIKYKWNLTTYRRCDILLGLIAGLIVAMFSPSIDRCRPFLTFLQVSISPTKPLNWFQLVVNSDYNPIVKLPLTNGSSFKDGQGQLKAYNLKRPRFVLDELNINDQLLIVVLTSDQSYANLGKLLNETLSPYADRILFVKQSIYPASPSSLSSLIILHQTDQSTLPFFNQVINYLNSSQELGKVKSTLQSFNFIFFISDNSYVKGDQLRKLVDSYSVKDKLFLIGSDLSDESSEFGHQSMDKCQSITNTDHWPNPQSGLLISASLVAYCNGELTCMLTFCSASVLRSYKLLPDHSDSLLLDPQRFRAALVTYPLFTTKGYANVNHLHLQQSLNYQLAQLSSLENQITVFIQTNHYSKRDWPPGIPSPHKPVDRFDVLTWKYHDSGLVYMADELDVVRTEQSNEISDLEYIKKLTVKWLTTKDSLASFSMRRVRFENIYTRFDANRGMEYLFDVTLSVKGNLRSKLKRIQVVKPLVPMTIIDTIPFTSEQSSITLIVPVQFNDEVSNVISLLNQFMSICSEKSSRGLSLVLALIQTQATSSIGFGKIKSLAISLQTKYPHSECKLIWSTIRLDGLVRPNDVTLFSLLWKRIPQTLINSIIVKLATNTILSADYLSRVQMNTIKGFQVYFPIPFQEYALRPGSSGSPLSPSSSTDYSWRINKDNGIFSWNDYRSASFYMDDFWNALAAVESVTDKVDGKIHHNYDLIEMFLIYNCVNFSHNYNSNQGIHILRAIEPELRLKFKLETCNINEIDRFSRTSCNVSRIYSYGSKAQLANLILNYKRSNLNDFS